MKKTLFLILIKTCLAFILCTLNRKTGLHDREYTFFLILQNTTNKQYLNDFLKKMYIRLSSRHIIADHSRYVSDISSGCFEDLVTKRPSIEEALNEAGLNSYRTLSDALDFLRGTWTYEDTVKSYNLTESEAGAIACYVNSRDAYNTINGVLSRRDRSDVTRTRKLLFLLF